MSSNEMLSKVLLSFQDPELKQVYAKEKIDFYNKAAPVIAVTMTLMSGTLEVMYTAQGLGELPGFIRIVNWVSVIFFALVWALHSRWNFLHAAVCPLLTTITFLYVSFIDYDYTMGSIYYSLIVGFTISFFILVIFNEVWLASTITYAIFMSHYMRKTGIDLLESESSELALRCVFCVLIYTIIAYKVEQLTKQSFMGRESSEKAFHRWMKIFETFPEGIALVRNNYIMYANRASKHILEVGLNQRLEDDPLLEKLKEELKLTNVVQWVKSPADLKKMGLTEPKHFSVWHFLSNNERGAIFRLLPKTKKENDDLECVDVEVDDEYLNEIPKYVTLNQVNVRIAGGYDKLLVVRDVTSIVMNEKIMETKREMSKLTDQLMASIDTYASYAEQKIEKMDQYVLEHEGKKLNDESILELKKLRYRIKDFQSIYNVSENAFRPKYESTSVQKLLKDAQEMAQADINNRNIDIQVEVDPEIPETISTDLNKLQQVILNLFLSSVNNQFRGFIKIRVTTREMGVQPQTYICIEIENSKFEIKPKEAMRLGKLTSEKQFARILESKVDINFKIAKILTNALDWQIDFNAFKQGKQTLMIPMQKDPNAKNTNIVDAVLADEKTLFEQIEGPRQEVTIEPKAPPPKPIVYPLRRAQNYPEVLLVSYSDLKAVLVEKIGYKCDDVQMEENAVGIIKKRIREYQDKNKKFYSYIIVNLDDVSIIIERFGRKIKMMLQEVGIMPNEVNLYAFCSTDSEKIRQHCQRAHFKFFNKPEKSEELEVLSHMAPHDDERSNNKDRVDNDSKLTREQRIAQLKEKQGKMTNELEQSVMKNNLKLAEQSLGAMQQQQKILGSQLNQDKAKHDFKAETQK